MNNADLQKKKKVQLLKGDVSPAGREPPHYPFCTSKKVHFISVTRAETNLAFFFFTLPFSVSIISPICSHLSTSGLFAVWRLYCYSWELRSRFHLSTYFLSSPPPPIFSMLEAVYSTVSHAHTQRVSSESGCLFSSRVFTSLCVSV